MSERHTELASGNAFVVAKTKVSFAERFEAAGFYLPDQARMRHMMKAATLKQSWGISKLRLAVIGFFKRAEPFVPFSLADYLQVAVHSWGAPVPHEIMARIDRHREQFPKMEVRIHALRDDDPFVEYVLDGESIFAQAWIRKNARIDEIYPPVR